MVRLNEGTTGHTTGAPGDTCLRTLRKHHAVTCATAVGVPALAKPPSPENHSTCGDASAMIGLMFRYAFHLAASAVADAPKAAVPILVAAVDGARS